MRRFFLGGIILLSLHAPAQTLFTYGKDSVSVKDFLHAYNKNNTAVKNSKALQEYLDLYIASRLKIKEALVRGYDTLPQLVSDIDNLRTQIFTWLIFLFPTTILLVSQIAQRRKKRL
jgi:peptidyl-prolyl cis-trans isomerase SurA